MFYYDKRIRYLRYFECGVKLQNAGYVKFQVRDQICHMVINIRGPRLMGSGEADIYLERKRTNSLQREDGFGNDSVEKRFFGKMFIRGGQGYFSTRVEALSMGNARLCYDTVCGICIELSDTQCMLSRWDVENPMPSSMKEETEYTSVIADDMQDEERESVNEAPELEKTFLQQGMEREEFLEVIEPNANNTEKEDSNVYKDISMPDTTYQDGNTIPTERNSKHWEKLAEKLQIVHPLGEEAYYKCTPSDFQYLKEEYRVLSHNSFLLHGYYNYKHLILGKREEDGQIVYYLGVPGVYYEREKTIAVLFGFSSFEGENNPPVPGDFGYYFKQVELCAD